MLQTSPLSVLIHTRSTPQDRISGSSFDMMVRAGFAAKDLSGGGICDASRPARSMPRLPGLNASIGRANSRRLTVNHNPEIRTGSLTIMMDGP